MQPHRARQRLRRQVRQRQRLGLGVGQRAVRQGDPAHGRAGGPRNIFPSNIQGLPTWYEVRVVEAGWLGRRGGVDLMVAMNPQTWDKDVAEIEPGGYLFYDSTKPLPRVDVPRRHHGARHAADRDLQRATTRDARQRQLFKNIIYVGALSALLDIDADEIERLIGEQYKGKEGAARRQPQGAARWAATTRSRTSTARSARASSAATRVGDRIFIDGNSAAALGARLRRRDGLRLVPDHAVVVAGRGVRAATAASSAPTRRPARSATPSCRPRTSWPRSAWSSAPAGTARARSPRRPAPASR